MAVKLRLQRHGRRKQPFYHIVAADSRSPRDGRYIEKIGTYNPMTVPATIDLDREKAFEWLMKGAQPTHTVRAMLRLKGVLYRKHLMRGVLKGALTEEEAMTKYEEWIADKDARLQKRADQSAEEKRAFQERVSGSAMPIVKEAQEAADDLQEASADAADTVAETVDDAQEAAADAVDAVAENVDDAQDAADSVIENVKEGVQNAVNAVEETVEEGIEKAKEVAEDIADAAGDAIEKVKDAVSGD